MKLTTNTNHQALSTSENWYGMKTAAKLIGSEMGRTKLFKFLREEKFLMDNNEPYQSYVDIGYFKLTVKDIYGRNGQLLFRQLVTLISDEGIDAVKKRIAFRVSN